MPTATIFARTQGKRENPALLFLHAFPFSSTMWIEQMDFFEESFFCVAPDLPGFGESAGSPTAVTFERYVDAVLDYLSKEKIEKAIWCGLSMGGYLALRMYERAPERCRALVLCDTKASADGNEAKLKRWSAIQTLKKSRAEFNVSQWQALIGENSKLKPALKSQFDQLLSTVSDEAVASGLVALATRTDSTAALGKISVPTLILVGEEDKVTPINEAELLANSIKGSRKHVLRNVGHLSNLENPDDFSEQISLFVNGLSD